MTTVALLETRFQAMPRLKQLTVLALVAAFAAVSVSLAYVAVALGGVRVGDQRLHTGVLVLVYLVVLHLEIDWPYVFLEVWLLGILTIFVFATGAAATSFLIRGETAAATGAGVMFGAMLSFALGRYINIVLALLDEIIELGVKTARLVRAILARVIRANIARITQRIRGQRQ
jgi:hypothetical protein